MDQWQIVHLERPSHGCTLQHWDPEETVTGCNSTKYIPPSATPSHKVLTFLNPPKWWSVLEVCFLQALVGEVSFVTYTFRYFSVMQSSVELTKEIVMLEAEIMRLERHLLSLYRTAFEEHKSTLSRTSETQSKSETSLPTLKTENENEIHQGSEPRVKRNSLLCPYQSSPACGWVSSDTQSCASSFKTTSTRVSVSDVASERSTSFLHIMQWWKICKSSLTLSDTKIVTLSLAWGNIRLLFLCELHMHSPALPFWYA